jgi:hypothetical protein
VGPVKTATPLRAGGFRNKRAVANDHPESRELQPVKTSVKRAERSRPEAVKHSQSSTRN